MAAKPIVSVVIPTKDAGPSFADTIEAVLAQEIHGELELLIIDSGSTDGTVELSQNYPVILIEIEPKDFGHGRTRNLGIAESRGDYVALLVQDALPADGKWLNNLIESLLNDQAVAGAFSRQIPRPGADSIAQLVTNYWHVRSGGKRTLEIRDEAQFDSLSIEDKLDRCAFNNVSSLIRRSVWNKIPFPDMIFAEDVGWAFQVMKAGHKLVYEPSSKVIHSHQRSWQHDLRRAYIDGHTLAKLFDDSTPPPSTNEILAIIQLVHTVCASTNDSMPYLVSEAREEYLQHITGTTVLNLLNQSSPWLISDGQTHLEALIQFLNWQDLRPRPGTVTFPGKTTIRLLNAFIRKRFLQVFAASDGLVPMPPLLLKRIATSFLELLGSRTILQALQREGVQIHRLDFTAALEFWEFVTYLKSETSNDLESANRLKEFAAATVLGKWLGRAIHANQKSNIAHPMIPKIHHFFWDGDRRWDLGSLLSS